MIMLPIVDVKRIGNWYSVVVGDTTYNVLIQKEPKSVICEVSSIIVFDEDFNVILKPSLLNDIEKIMGKMDWKYDMLDVE
jgi:hypothetical protein